MVASSTPATAPRQPAWAAPTIAPSESANSTGAQSAVTIPSARSGPVGDHGVGFFALPGFPGFGRGHHMRAMHLRQAKQPVGIGLEGSGDAGAVFQHVVAVVLAGEAAVEAGVGAGRYPAAAGEETMRRRHQVRGQRFRHRDGTPGKIGSRLAGLRERR